VAIMGALKEICNQSIRSAGARYAPGINTAAPNLRIFNGAPPSVIVARTEAEEGRAVEKWIKEKIAEGLKPSELGIFVRSDKEVSRAKAAAEKAGLPVIVLDENMETKANVASISTMHLAKGLEFRAVVVMACDDEIIPLQSRIETAADESDLEEVYNTERHLFYVACTRARDFLFISSVEPPAEFLSDLGA